MKKMYSMRNGICMFGIKVHAKAGQAATTKNPQTNRSLYTYLTYITLFLFFIESLIIVEVSV